ncbi:MAG TPA: hypothetical protein VM432_07900 [Bdellovibrionales bacterium]|nr:hypothetical protein [Bdellovibrionales bacterium]
MENKSFRLSPRTIVNSNNSQTFKSLANQLSEIGVRCGTNIIPYSHESVPLFNDKSDSEQNLIIENLRDYLHICENTLDRGYSPKTDGQLLWSALRRFNLRPTSDLFQYIGSGNVIEIHTAEAIQIFRNFGFFELCSYSLEDLYCRPWSDLYQRDKDIEKQLIGCTMQMFSGKVNSTVRLNVERHTITETTSPRRLSIQADLNYGAPLFSGHSGEAIATIVIEDAKLISAEGSLR